MANQEHIDQLLLGTSAWNRWREENPDIIPQLQDAKLNGIDLRGAYLYRANLQGAQLVEAHLSGANLTNSHCVETNFTKALIDGADLGSAMLVRANLSDAKLRPVNLNGAMLYGAKLHNAALTGSILSSAILNEADFLGADLTGVLFHETNLAGASLSNANFTEAMFHNTIVASVDLSFVRGLETTVHFGPSIVGVDTLFLSQGKIPEVFLRGCGVPEDLITYIPSLTNNPIEYYSCFISYSHADKTFARQLHDFLQGHGIRCWLDEHQLVPGQDLHDEIDRGIKLWDKVVLCASKHSLTSWWVDSEIDRAFRKEATIMKERDKKVLALIPLNLDNFLFKGWENGKAEQVKSRLAADFTEWKKDNEKLQQQFEVVLKALRTDGGREEPPPPRL